MDDDQTYLQPGFDPASLTVPRLRSILVAHSINYPASAKKPQLIQIFNDEVIPQARKLRNASLRVKRTSKGIEDVPASQTSAQEEEELEPPPSTASRRTGRRTTRARTEEAEEVEPTPRQTRHSTAPPDHAPRRVSSKHVRQVEPVVEEEPMPKRPASRKSRLSAATPSAVKLETDDDSPFSSENVFQASSSPPPASDRRRTTLGPARDRDDERRKSREIRRRTEEYRTSKPLRDQASGVVVPTRKTFEMPVSRFKKEQDEDDAVEPSEEFTPEEQLELTRAEQSGTVVTTQRKKPRPRSAAKTAPLTVALAMLAGIAGVWRHEKLEVGYCGVGRPTMEVGGVQIPDWADVLRPQCEPCPPHAYCDDHLLTTCEPGFVLTPHPLALGGTVPLPPTCEPDSARTRKVQAVKARAVEELREQNAKYECGEASTSEVKESALEQAISTKRRKGMSNEEFEDLWASALGEIQSADEIISGSDGSGFTFRSTSLARLPLACAIRRSLRETVKQHLRTLVIIAIILGGSGYTKYSIEWNKKTEEQAKQLARMTLDKLSQQASLHTSYPDSYGEGFVSIAQLRDDVLRDEFSGTKRKKIWEKVQKKVENNSNVRAMTRTGRSGDVSRAWEWIGAVGRIEAAPASGDRRQSGGFRDSLGPIEGDSLVQDETVNRAPAIRWQEGGKYY